MSRNILISRIILSFTLSFPFFAAWADGEKKIEVVCVYYPHWHEYPKGNEWFGADRWKQGEWAFVKDARPLYPNHKQPLVPYAGFLDESDPKDMAKEIALAANAGVPLPVVASIVGHSSTAMTRHYYHENEEMLRQAVAAIPSLDDLKGGKPSNSLSQPPRSAQTVEQRLRQLEKLKRKSLISEEEYASTRSRILAEI